MKKVIAFPVAWFLWLVGISAFEILTLNDDSNGWVLVWYRIYNRSMIMSSDVQSWAVSNPSDLWPWETE